MDCAEARDRLVALDDGELGRSEEQVVLGHLAGCPACRDRRAALARATPRVEPVVPPAIRARLEGLDVDALLARPPRPAPPSPWVPRLGRRFEVPLGAILVYVFTLAAVTAWGVSNWVQNTAPGPQVAEHEAAGLIPAQAFRPASYTPGDDPFPAAGALPAPGAGADVPAQDDGPVYH